MKRQLQRLILLPCMALAMASSPHAQAPFSCAASFGAQQDGRLEPELRTWIILTARRLAKEHADDLARSGDNPCADLGCIGDDEIVASIGRQCRAKPGQTLEQAAEGVAFAEQLYELCERLHAGAACAARLGIQ